jgi:hypothetical protein
MEKTHWKKNNDSNFISGEDLISGLKGLKSEMIVMIDKFNDAESFDQKNQSKIVVSALFLKDITGKPLYKPVILNKTNAKFFVKETGSDFIDDWLNVPVTLYAMPDKRHGHVVRFKKFAKTELIKDSENFKNCKLAIQNSGFTMDKIRLKYNVSSEVEQLLLAK